MRLGLTAATPRPLPAWLPKTIVSGGQAGVDRAALDWAIAHQIPHSGWCPLGRRAEDGPLAEKYQLRETESHGYRQRTRLNVRDSDATLILNLGELSGGSQATVAICQELRRPYLLVQLDQQAPEIHVGQVTKWLRKGRFSVLNVAGPREGKRPDAYRQALSLLEQCLTA
jgi:hypothetical protein